MSLADRSKHFMKHFPGSKMNYTLLSRVYKMHGVKKRRITWKKKSNNRSKEELKREGETPPAAGEIKERRLQDHLPG